MCHLNVIDVHGRDVACATCGARGTLATDGSIIWTDLSTSVISMHEKRAHGVEIQETAAAHRGQQDEIDTRSSEFAAVGKDWIIRP